MQNKRYPRKIRIAELIRQSLCLILARSAEIPLLTLHEVDVASDYSTATVYYSLLDENPDSLQRAKDYFEENAREIRREVASGLQLRSTPKMEFRYAEELRRAEDMDRLVGRMGEGKP